MNCYIPKEKQDLSYYIFSKLKRKLKLKTGGINMEKEDYRKKIIEMVESIGNLEFLEMIYGFVKKLFNKDKPRN